MGLHHKKMKEEGEGNLDMEQVQEGVVEGEEEQVLHLLCLVQMEQVEVGNPWSAVGWMAVVEEAGCVRRALREVMQSEM